MDSTREILQRALAQLEPDDRPASVTASGNYAHVTIISQSTVIFGGESPARYGNGLPGEPDQTPTANPELRELAIALAGLETSTACHTVYIDSVWRRVAKSLGIPENTPIPAEREQDAKNYLAHRIQLAARDKQLPPEEAVARSRDYRICHDIAKRHGLETTMRNYMLGKWQTETMRELSTPDLRILKNHMRRLERKITARGISGLR